MDSNDKKISQLPVRPTSEISGAEVLPFAENNDNGAVSIDAIKEFSVSEISQQLGSLNSEVQRINDTLSPPSRGEDFNDWRNDVDFDITELKSMIQSLASNKLNKSALRFMSEADYADLSVAEQNDGSIYLTY